jgi:hypothetical protein
MCKSHFPSPPAKSELGSNENRYMVRRHSTNKQELAVRALGTSGSYLEQALF